MMHAQISTVAVTLSVLTLLPWKRASAVFGRILFLLICCTYVVVFASDCSQREKWTWFVVKALLLLSNLLVHRETLRFSVRDYAFSLGILLLYLSLVDIHSIYRCRVRASQLALTFASASLTFALFKLSRS